MLGGGNANAKQQQPVSAGALCVGWAVPGWQRDEKLERELTRPGLTLMYARDDLEAVALLCGDFAKHGPKAARAMILLLVEPTELEGLAEALDVLEARLPVLHVWVFDATRSPVLRGVTMFELREMLSKAKAQTRGVNLDAVSVQRVQTSWVGPVVASGSQKWTDMATSSEHVPSKPTPIAGSMSSSVMPGRAHVGGPVLRLTDDDVPRGRASENDDGPSRTGPLLSDDEMSMLLGDDEPKQPGRGEK